MRRTPLKRGGPLKRTGGLRPQSRRRTERRDERAKVSDNVRRRAGDRCEAIGLVEHTCFGPIDVHEVFPRSAWPDGIYDEANCVCVCRWINDTWVKSNPDEAERVGLHVRRSTADRVGRSDAIAEAALRRNQLRGRTQ